MSKLIVRELSELDMPRLLELGMEYWESLKLPFSFDLDYVSSIGSFSIKSKDFCGLGLVDTEKAEIVGFIWGHLSPQLYTPDTQLVDVLTYIRPEYRNDGHSTPLFKAYEQWGKDRGAKSIQLSTVARKGMKHAVNVYEHLGYKVTGYITSKEV
jgi:GNAT superfamily N-acetyltransferase